jgi:hypothetical protein
VSFYLSINNRNCLKCKVMIVLIQFLFLEETVTGIVIMTMMEEIGIMTTTIMEEIGIMTAAIMKEVGIMNTQMSRRMKIL